MTYRSSLVAFFSPILLLLSPLSGPSAEEAAACLACHQDQAGVLDTRHGTPGDPDSPAGSGRACSACHGENDAHPDDPPRQPVPRTLHPGDRPRAGADRSLHGVPRGKPAPRLLGIGAARTQRCALQRLPRRACAAPSRLGRRLHQARPVGLPPRQHGAGAGIRNLHPLPQAGAHRDREALPPPRRGRQGLLLQLPQPPRRPEPGDDPARNPQRAVLELSRRQAGPLPVPAPGGRGELPLLPQPPRVLARETPERTGPQPLPGLPRLVPAPGDRLQRRPGVRPDPRVSGQEREHPVRRPVVPQLPQRHPRSNAPATRGKYLTR